MNRKTPLALFASWIALLAAPPLTTGAAGAETAGTGNGGLVVGRVSNAATKLNLEGALVELLGTNHSVRTDRDGFFRLPAPAGSHTLAVSYTGLDAQQIPIVVGAAETIHREVALSAEIYKLDAFTVSGEREGSALAIQQQRHAPHVKNVLSADAFGNVADENLGNFLVRVPGVGTRVSEGEIVSVQVRGISPDLSAVTVDGTRAPNGSTATALGRGFEIDKLPADFIETIEVTKAATPDMDADSVGGAINLKTKSAFTRQGRTISYQLGASHNVRRGTYRPAGSFMFADTFGSERRLGVMFTTSYNQTHKPRDSSNIAWEETPATDRPNYFYMTNYGEDGLKHTRGGTGLRFDYKLSNDSTLYLNAMYAYYQDELARRRGTFSGINNNVVAMFNAAGLPRTATNAAATILPGWTTNVTNTINHTFTFTQFLRTRTVESLNFQAGGRRKFRSAELDFNVNYSPSRGTDQRVTPSSNVPGVGFRFDRNVGDSRASATWTQISGPVVFDPANRVFSSLNDADDVNRDRIMGAQANLRHDFDLAVDAYVKVGLRARRQERDRIFRRGFFGYRGPDGVAGRNPATGVNDDDLARFIDRSYNYSSYDRFYPPTPFFSIPVLVETRRSSPQLFQENRVSTLQQLLRSNVSSAEEVGAAYVMGGLKLGRLGILSGVRVERTRVTGTGTVQEVSPEERARRAAWVGVVTEEEQLRRTRAELGNIRTNRGVYQDVFPSVHFRYELAHGLIARASYSTGIGRPSFDSIIPNDAVDHDRELVTANNAKLRPQYADNFDLALEYYFEPVGLLSAGAFLKELSSFFFTTDSGFIGDGADNGFGGDYAGYRLRTQRNGGSARVRGLEFAYQQQFSNLRGFWRGFGVFANYTYLETMGDYGTPGATTTQADLIGFVPRSGNVGLNYSGHRWNVRLQMNYTGSYVTVFETSPTARQYTYPKRPIDLSLKYMIDPRLALFLDVINVLSDPIQKRYQFIRSRKSGDDLYSPVIKAGISGRF